MLLYFILREGKKLLTPNIFLRFVEAPALAPPEFVITDQEAHALEQELAEAASAPLPDDDDEL